MTDQMPDLASKLDKELEEFISQLKPKKYEDGWPEDRWEEEMGKHPFFMEKPLKENEEVPPLVEALQQLKYDPSENTPDELAKAHKEDGNQYFKVKKYRWAIEAYTEGIKQDCKDKVLKSQLLVNRAAAHFHLGNYRKSLKDATEAKVLQPGYMKAIQRGALCCLSLKQFDECLAWCQEGLEIEPSHSELKELKVKAEKEQKIMERDRRKEAAKASKEKKEIMNIQDVLKKRGINFKEPMKPEHPDLLDFMVHLDENNCLVWPVMLLYPEHGMTDCIQHFHEDSSFADHFEEMFCDSNRPSWDVENKYRPENLQVYFKSIDDKLVPVNSSETLKSVISMGRFELCSGTPTFFVTVRKSKFDQHFLEKASFVS